MIDKIKTILEASFSSQTLYNKRLIINGIFLFAYFFIFLVFFLSKYTSDSVPGTSDVILNISIFNQYPVLIKGLFTEQTTAFYPYKWFILLGDPIPILAVIFYL